MSTRKVQKKQIKTNLLTSQDKKSVHLPGRSSTVQSNTALTILAKAADSPIARFLVLPVGSWESNSPARSLRNI